MGVGTSEDYQATTPFEDSGRATQFEKLISPGGQSLSLPVEGTIC